MNISKQDLDWAVSQGMLSQSQAETLWTAFSERKPGDSAFSFVNVMYYLGALIVVSALTIFMSLGWDWFSGLGIAGIGLAYAIGFLLLGRYFWSGKDLKIPGGLMYTLAVGMVPLIIYGIQKWLGLWTGEAPESYRSFFNFINSNWIIMEIGTVLAGLVALYYVRFPFLLFPICFALLFLSYDIVGLFTNTESIDWDLRRWVSLVFGLSMMATAYFIDSKTRDDYSFWLYFFGLIAFSCGLTLLWDYAGEPGKFLVCAISFGLIVLSIILDRRLLLVFGGIGIFSYLSYLAYSIFSHSILFPFVLSFIGLGIIFAGIMIHKHFKHPVR